MFVHLHNHTDFSLLDSVATVEGYVNKAKALGMSSLAITDHGNMYGVLTFYKACKKKNIKPIIGCEFYIAPKGLKDKDSEDRYSHLILLAMDETGYKNLLKLNTVAYTEGFYYKPRIDHDSLKTHSEGLICLSACVSGEIPKAILKDDMKKAKDLALWYKGVFGDRFYLELQNHGLKDEIKATKGLVSLSKELNIPIVCTNDIHYIEKEDWEIHDVLLCVGTRKKLTDHDRMRYKEGEFYFRTEEEMAELFPREALDNTVEIAQRCNLEIKLPGPILPKCPIPAEFNSDNDYLRHLAYEGLANRYPNNDRIAKLKERLEYELGIIIQLDFSSYFLIVQDYINWAKANGITVGPGRGSGAGSLVAYCIGITNVDPIKYDLLFERFLNPERVSMPDFDVDFCFERRGEVVDYVSRVYGKDHVGQICTFGTLKAKAVLKDVARVLDFSASEANELTALFPDKIEGKDEVGLADALEATPMLQDIIKNSSRHQKLFDIALRLEGLNRHVSLHAAGVVIGREALDNYVPLSVPDQEKGIVATQFTKNEIEDCGLVKMDFLGLRTLTLIDKTVRLIREKEPDFDINNIPDNDKATFEMMKNAESDCVFQFESPGMKKKLKQVKPDNFGDLVALSALFRPGPEQFIDKFVEGKRNPACIEYPDPSLVELLKPTYGVIVYQEQVMKAAQIIAGYSLGQADNLRRIMGKKQKEKLAGELVKFVDGAIKNGHTREHAEEIFHILEPFAGYGFNKSHAVAYTVISYQTAYLKAHYPVEFMAANLTNEINNPDKFSHYITVCEQLNIPILRPSVNFSRAEFSVEGNSIRFGLSGIKGIGKAVAELIQKEHSAGTFRSLDDFISRIDESVLNSRVLEGLITCGAFGMNNREGMLASYPDMIKTEKKNRKSNNNDCEMFLFEIPKAPFKHIEGEQKTMIQWMNLERDFMNGFVLTDPLNKFDPELTKSCTVGNKVRTLGIIISRKDKTTKKGELMANLTVRTKEEVLEYVVFSSRYECLPPKAKAGDICFFWGNYKLDKTRTEEEEPRRTFVVHSAQIVTEIA